MMDESEAPHRVVEKKNGKKGPRKITKPVAKSVKEDLRMSLKGSYYDQASLLEDLSFSDCDCTNAEVSLTRKSRVFVREKKIIRRENVRRGVYFDALVL